MVQPQDSVTLNGVESKDDNKIVSFQWKMLTGYPYAVIQVSKADQSLSLGVRYSFNLSVPVT